MYIWRMSASVRSAGSFHMICPSGVIECAPDRSWNIGSVMSSVTPCREPGRDRTRTTPARHQLVILRLGGVPLVRHGATVWDGVAWHGPTDRIVASAGCFPIQRMLVQMQCVYLRASVCECAFAFLFACLRRSLRSGSSAHVPAGSGTSGASRRSAASARTSIRCML